MNKRYKTRYHGIDILRLVWLYAIIHFHILETFFYSNTYTLNFGDSLYSFLYYPVRALAFSGFAIVTLTSFLLGWIELDRKKWLSLMSILALGALFLSWLEGDEYKTFYVQWDIYYFHFASFALIALLQTRPWILYGIAILFFPLLFYPVWIWDSALDSWGWWKDLMLGDCSRREGQGAWPLLPWLALPLLMYSAARLIRTHSFLQSWVHQFSWREGVLWGLAIGALSPWIGGYFHTPIGSQFACYVHRRTPIEFWSQWLCVLLLMRLSLVDTINVKLSRQRWVRWLSQLQWSQNMGIAYALHFVFLNLGYNWAESFQTEQYKLDLFFVFLIVGVEVLCRVLRWVFQYISKTEWNRL